VTAIKHRCDERGGGWTLDTLQEHWQVVNGLQREFLEERDRRYSEVKAAEEKALAVKQRADEQALGLAREIQIYKDEKANELREQISSERGSYATKEDLAASVRELTATISPLTSYVSGDVRSEKAVKDHTALIVSMVGLGVSLLIGAAAVGSLVMRLHG
jgi:outer membrane murein-binding lipoprotein Lpp